MWKQRSRFGIWVAATLVIYIIYWTATESEACYYSTKLSLKTAHIKKSKAIFSQIEERTK